MTKFAVSMFRYVNIYSTTSYRTLKLNILAIQNQSSMKLITRFLCVVAVFAFAKAHSQSSPTFNTLSPELAAQVDAVFEDTNKPGYPGAALGIFKDGEIIYAKGYGYANLEYDIPITSKSVFRIASTSKQFTAACIVLLEQQGKLNLDDTLDKFFPDFPNYARTITVKQLLNHTSGIRDYLVLSTLAGLGDDDYYTDDDLMQWLVNQEELNFEPGSAHLYSNSGYWLLGQIVKKVTGESMAIYAENEIFKPLGMENTHFHDDHMRIVKNRASGYYPIAEDKFIIAMTTLDMIGDGGIFTTIEDLKKWDDAFYASEILNIDFWKTMTTKTILNDGTENEYAAGLEVGMYDGHKLISHGGAFVGFRAQKFLFPDDHFTVVVLANRGDAQPDQLASRVTDLFLEPIEMADGVAIDDTGLSGDNSAFAKALPIKLSAAALKKLEGDYWSEESQHARKLVVVNDTLTYDRNDGRVTKMVPVAENKLRWVGPNIPIILTLDKTDTPQRFELEIPGQGISKYERFVPLTKLTAAQLNLYAGDYYSKELDVTYTFKKMDEGLMLFVNGKEFATAEPVIKDRFTVGGFLSLEFSPNQKEFRAAAGRVKNLKFVRK